MLGLKAETDAAWADGAIGDLGRVLVDHAHCEMKAASNALSLASRHYEIPEIVRTLTELAREEIDHFQRVLGLLEARGLALGPPPVDEYAAALRQATAAEKRGSKHWALVDRLLVGALIEARSCERFKLLAAALERAGEREVSAFYTELLAAEARHYRDFVDLAVLAAEKAPRDRALPSGPAAREQVLERLDVFAEREAAIVRALAHQGAPTDRSAIHG
jgi:tRNA-(ms[2]io[6]A)-hydroxylase